MSRTITLPCKLSIPHSIFMYPSREVSVMAVFGAKSGKFLRVEHDEELPDFKPVLGENLKPSNIDLDYCYGYWVVKFCGKDIDYFVRLQDALEYLDTLADQPISAGY